MLIPKPDIRIVTKKVTLQNGTEALAYFAIIDVQGVLEARFLGTKAIEENAAASAAPLLLDSPRVQIFGEYRVTSFFDLLSPFYTLDFLVNALARAPSVK